MQGLSQHPGVGGRSREYVVPFSAGLQRACSRGCCLSAHAAAWQRAGHSTHLALLLPCRSASHR
jgi:hypothetical protein